MSDRVVVVGNGVGGYACAARLARNGLRPLLVGPGLPVDRPPLTKGALVKGEPVLLADAARLDERGIQTLDAFVDEVELGTGRVVAGGVEIDAEAIVLATGLSYRPPPIPGLDVAHVNATPGGMRRLVADLGRGERSVAVLGGGLIGVETAATLATLGHRVTVLDLLERPLDRLHDPLPALALATLVELGIDFLGARPSSASTTRVRRSSSARRWERSRSTSSSPRWAVASCRHPGSRSMGRSRSAATCASRGSSTSMPSETSPSSLMRASGRCGFPLGHGDRDGRAGSGRDLRDRGRGGPASVLVERHRAAPSRRGRLGGSRGVLGRRGRDPCRTRRLGRGRRGLVVDEPRRLREARALVQS